MTNKKTKYKHAPAGEPKYPKVVVDNKVLDAVDVLNDSNLKDLKVYSTDGVQLMPVKGSYFRAVKGTYFDNGKDVSQLANKIFNSIKVNDTFYAPSVILCDAIGHTNRYDADGVSINSMKWLPFVFYTNKPGSLKDMNRRELWRRGHRTLLTKIVPNQTQFVVKGIERDVKISHNIHNPNITYPNRELCCDLHLKVLHKRTNRETDFYIIYNDSHKVDDDDVISARLYGINLITLRTNDLELDDERYILDRVLGTSVYEDVKREFIYAYDSLEIAGKLYSLRFSFSYDTHYINSLIRREQMGAFQCVANLEDEGIRHTLGVPVNTSSRSYSNIIKGEFNISECPVLCVSNGSIGCIKNGLTYNLNVTEVLNLIRNEKVEPGTDNNTLYVEDLFTFEAYYDPNFPTSNNNSFKTGVFCSLDGKIGMPLHFLDVVYDVMETFNEKGVEGVKICS